jgi:hypothetical protein
MQQFFKTPPGIARTGVVASELLDEFFVAMDDAEARFDVRLGGVAPAALACSFKSGRWLGGRCGVA